MPGRKKKSSSKGKADRIQREILDESRLTLDDFAKAAGRKRVTIEKYRELKARMPRDVRERIARFLEDHASRLQDFAKELRQKD